MSLSPLDLISLTYNSLRSNPLRSGLNMLGIFMGVAAITGTLQVGNISYATIERRLAEREAPQVTAYLWRKNGGRLSLEDMEFLKQRLKSLQAISTYTWFNKGPVIFEDKQARLTLHAVSPDYLQTSGRTILQGRFFNDPDFVNFRSVVVIDQFLVDQLFAGEDPIGKRIYAVDTPYLVVGVMETKLKSEEEEEPTGEILVPLSLYRVLTASREVGSLQLRPKRIQDINTLQEQVEQLLLQRYPGSKFWAKNNVEDLLKQQQTLELVSRGLLVLGVISLLVGGVGIANITLASVMERTEEIGLQRALGATRRDIWLQFILEAAWLSLLGGTIALITVHGVTKVVAVKFDLPYEFQVNTAGVALGSALLIGVGSSFFPALQASKLDPVKALRS